MKLDDRQIDLFSRQIILRELGGTGQRRLLESRCLLIGEGAAIETAASYLTGAGVGALHLWRSPVADRGGRAGDAGRSPALGFAPLAERGGETELRWLDSPGVDLAAYDLILLEGERSAGSPDPAELLAPARGAARRGGIGVVARPGRWVGVTCVPCASGACLACARLVDDDRPAAPAAIGVGADAVALPFAGAMAALVALRWLAEIAPETATRGLRLGPDDGVWVDAAIERVPPCPRGCRPPA